jgi:hypothetical protein
MKESEIAALERALFDVTYIGTPQVILPDEDGDEAEPVEQ